MTAGKPNGSNPIACHLRRHRGAILAGGRRPQDFADAMHDHAGMF